MSKHSFLLVAACMSPIRGLHHQQTGFEICTDGYSWAVVCSAFKALQAKKVCIAEACHADEQRVSRLWRSHIYANSASVILIQNELRSCFRYRTLWLCLAWRVGTKRFATYSPNCLVYRNPTKYEEVHCFSIAHYILSLRKKLLLTATAQASERSRSISMYQPYSTLNKE